MTASGRPANGSAEIPAPWPVRAGFPFTLNRAECRAAKALARRTLAAEPALDPAWFRAIGAAPGWAPGPSVYLEDHRPIELISDDAASIYEYRSLALAGDGDHYIVSKPRAPDFEAYLRDTVGLGAPTVRRVRGAPAPLEHRTIAGLIAKDAGLMNRLVKAARAAPGLNIAPFIATGRVWSLAAEIARRAARPVRVVGPSPRLARRANDKLWFTARATELLGREAAPPTVSVHGLAAAAARIRQLAARHDRIVLKCPASAGSAGNLRFAADEFRGRSLSAIRGALAANLRRITWRSRFPLLVGVWEHPIAESPSAQFWIPASTDAPPVLEGVFTQSLAGRAGRFVGARRADLPAPAADRFVNQAQRLALFFQALGYFGRLSLDAVLVGEDLAKASIHWIECNARWGGVSIPMTVANRLYSTAPVPAIVIVQEIASSAADLSLNSVLARVGDALIRSSDPRNGVVFLSPTDRGRLIFACLAGREAEALALAERVLQASIGGAGAQPGPAQAAPGPRQ